MALLKTNLDCIKGSTSSFLTDMLREYDKMKENVNELEISLVN